MKNKHRTWKEFFAQFTSEEIKKLESDPKFMAAYRGNDMDEALNIAMDITRPHYNKPEQAKAFMKRHRSKKAFMDELRELQKDQAPPPW